MTLTERGVTEPTIGLRGLSPRAIKFQLDSYLRDAVDRDIPELAVRKRESMLAWLRA